MRELSILGITLCVMMMSCTPQYHAPSTHNVPLITEKGDLNFNVSASPEQVEIQQSYGISDKISVMANGGVHFRDRKESDGGSGYFGELGLGYYNTFTEYGVFEIYTFGGVGSVENHFNDNDRISSQFMRLGIQPNIAYLGNTLQVALSSRFFYLHYYNPRGSLTYGGQNQVDYLKQNAHSLMIEPAVTIRVGNEKGQLQVQGGYSLNLSNTAFYQRMGLLSIGLNFNF